MIFAKDKIEGGFSTAKQYEDEFIWIQRGRTGLSYGTPKEHMISIDLRLIPSSARDYTVYFTGEDADDCWKGIQSWLDTDDIVCRRTVTNEETRKEFIEFVYRTYFSCLKPNEVLAIISDIIDDAKKAGRNEMREQFASLLDWEH